MKRVLSLVLAFMLVFSSILPAFAEEATFSEDGQKLVDYKIIAGTGNGDDAEGQLTRAAMTVLLAAMYGEKEVAETYAFTPSFTDVAEGKWYTPYIAYAEQKGWMSGDAAGGTFRPDDAMKAQEVNAMFLKALGYTVAWDEVNAKAEEMEIAVVAADPTLVLRGEAFATILEVLDTPKMDETDTLGTALAIPNYSEPTPPAPETVAVDSAKSLNANVIEVVLDDADDLAAPTAVNVEQFSVVDEDDAALEVEKVEFAPWDADNYTVLVTVSDDMEAGSLYTVASGDATADFGGLADDETKPAIDDSVSNDYNEVKITFSEAVLLDDISISIAEKYGDKDELAVLDYEYSGNNKIIVTTDEQADATLYEVEIDGLVDLAGNEAKDLTSTFTGQEKNTDEQTVGSANAVDSVTVDVTFDINVDVESAEDAANYEIAAKYGDKEEVAVASAEMKTDSDGDVIKNVVRLTLAEDTKDATLYEVTVDNVGTLYGKGLDSDGDSTTFTGKGPDTDEPAGFTASADNNTSVTLTIDDDSEIAEEYDVALFTIAEKYGDKDELAVIAIDEVDAEAKTITLTTGEQKGSTLYEVTVAEGLADKFGNVTDDELTNTFTGASVADEISSVTATNTADKKVKVTFDENYGDNALSVASYSIDGGIGYPSKVEKITGSKDAVLLTVSELKVGTVYTVTVKNVYNADGVAMDKDGVTDKFGAIYGNSDTDITLEAAVAQNNQTITLYFNDDAADLTGLVDANDELESGALFIKKEADADSAYVELAGYAYVDPEFDTRLIVTVTANDAFDNADDDEFFIKIVDTQVTNIESDDDANIIKFAENTSEPTQIKVDGIVSLDDQTLKVYFNQAVREVTHGSFAKVAGEFDATAGSDNVLFTNAYPLNDEKTEWKFVLASPMTADTANELDFVVLDDEMLFTHSSASTLDFQNDSGTSLGADGSVVFFDETPTSNLTTEFSKNTTSTDYIKDVGVVMEDSKTLKLFFPEWMAASAYAVDSYEIFTANDGTTQPSYTDESGSAVVEGTSQITITRAVYEEVGDGTSTVTLTTDDKLGSYSKLYLAVKVNTVYNKAGNKVVETAKDADDDKLYKEFSVNTGAAADVAVSRVDADASADTVTIRLDQPVAIGDGDLLAGGDVDYASKTAFAAEFTIKVDGSELDSAKIQSIAASHTSKTTEDGVSAGDDNDVTIIVVTYDDGLVVGGKDVEVSVTDSETTPKLIGIYNDEDLKDDSDAVRTVVADTDVPTAAFTGVTYDKSDDTVVIAGSNFELAGTLDPSKITLTTDDKNDDAGSVVLTGATVVIDSASQITITVTSAQATELDSWATTTVNQTLASAGAANWFKDFAGNSVAGTETGTLTVQD